MKRRRMASRTPRTFLYVLHSGNLYGTERMALITLEELQGNLKSILVAPEGPVVEAARALGIETFVFKNLWSLVQILTTILAKSPRLVFAATGVIHSLLFIALNSVYRRAAHHIHLVHGGTDERHSYGRKRLLNRFDVRLVAVSNFVKRRLVANGVNPNKIDVLENFLPDEQIDAAPRRSPFREHGLRQVIVVSRIDPIKKVDLLLDCLDLHPELRHITFRIYGTGWDLDALRSRAHLAHPNVTFEGFSSSVPERLAESDLLLHLCPEEPFGLVILEAMAAGVPVLVPTTGGAAEIVEPGVSGFHFGANNSESLARALLHIDALSSQRLNTIVKSASTRLHLHYSSSAGVLPYKNLIGVSS